MMELIVKLTYHSIPDGTAFQCGIRNPRKFRGLGRGQARAQESGAFGPKHPSDPELESGFVVTSAVHD